jgi:hypothetical protein
MNHPNESAPHLVGHHEAEAPAYDDFGEPVAVSEFRFPVDGEPDQQLGALAAQRSRLEIITRLIGLLAAGDAKKAGRRVHALAFILHASDCRNQRDLAKRLGVTPGRVSQILNEVKHEYLTAATD